MRKKLLAFSLLTALSLGGVVLASRQKEYKEAKGYSTSTLPTTIDLNDTSAANIRSYYSSLNNLSTSERQGTNLLKNLKTILKNGQKFYSYDSGSAIWQIYEIADRDWDKSPASSTTYGTYNSGTNKITNYTYGTSTSSSRNNPYIHALYINRNVDNQVTAWDDHQQTQWGINREHVWPKAEGFDGTENNLDGSGGARGDPMHLMAGNGYSNNIHSNYFYGYVNTSSSYTDCGTKYSNVSGNLLGKSLTVGGSTNVFEPQDCDKGDIARAIFYMVARYNYLSGSDSDGIDSNNPNLTLTQSLSDWSSSGYASTTSRNGYMGLLTDLLAWHHADPVDQYEIHRNNLLYTNYTNNRNPFIDFPEWVDFIWGNATYNGRTYQSYSSTPTGYATPSSDTINGYNANISVTGVSLNKNSTTLLVGGSETLTATITPNNATNTDVTWSSSNETVATVSNGTISALKAGSTTITVTTDDGGFTATCSVTVNNPTVAVTGVSLNKNSTSIQAGGSETLTATVTPNNATNKNVTWTSSNTNVATVSNGTVSAVAEGNTTITVTTVDGGFTATCTVEVTSGGSQVPSGDASLYSGAITEGDYVIYYDGKAMANSISGNRFSYSEVTPVENIIESPSTSIVWHIAPSGDYWTIYNETVSKYAAGTGANNKGQLISSNDDNDSALWSASGTSTYEFVNKRNSTAGVNCYLRENGTYGFACYSTYTGGALSLYKVQESAAEITSISAIVDKTYHVGETISKSDITVKDSNDNDVADFTFEDDGYQFTYADASSGGALTNKQFTVSYEDLDTTLTVQVSREAYVAPDDEVRTLSAAEGDFYSLSGTSSSPVTNTVTKEGIDYVATESYVYPYNGVNYLAFYTKKGTTDYKTDSVFYNDTIFPTSIKTIAYTLGGGYIADADLIIEYSPDNEHWSTLNTTDNYYFRIRCESEFKGYFNIFTLTVTLNGEQTAANIANFIMYEDTNNQCESKLDTAISYFGNMSSLERASFMTSEEYVIATARTRLQAWSTNQNKSINYSEGDYVISTISKQSLIADLDSENPVVLIAVLSSVSLLSIYAFVKKKKQEE